MKPLLPLLLTLLLKLTAAGPPAGRVTLSPVTKAVYLAAKKRAVATMPPLTFPVKKERGRIVIPTSKGPKVFRDVRKAEDETAVTTYTYLGYAEALRLHILQIQLWETSEFKAVDARGNNTELWSPPIFSPQLHHLITVSANLKYDMMPSGLQLFRCAPSGLQKVWELAATAWEPDETGVFWASESTVFIRQRRYQHRYGNKNPYFTYAKLTIQ